MSRDLFASFHTPGTPLVLFNIWDAGSAVAVAKAGAKAIATGSASLAGAQGFADGEAIPLEALLVTTRQIHAAIQVPLTVDFESGFAEDVETLSANARALAHAGAVGCNLEDQLIGSGGLRDPDEQAARIAAVSEAGLFVNARTDVFLEALRAGDDANRDELVEAAIARGAVYKQAGAGSFFAPGLSDSALITRVIEAVELPVNVMRLPGIVSNAELAKLGVARISYGPGPWREAMAALQDAAGEAFSS